MDIARGADSAFNFAVFSLLPKTQSVNLSKCILVYMCVSMDTNATLNIRQEKITKPPNIRKRKRKIKGEQ